MQDFQGNKETDPPKKESARVIQPVTTNVKEVKKKKFFSFKNKIVSGDADSVGSFVMTEVIFPKIKDAISAAVKYSVDFILYGKNGASIGNKNGTSYINYNNQYASTIYRPINYSNQPTNYGKPVNNTIYQIRHFVFNSRGEAESVCIALMDSISRYGSVSVNDFYDFIGQNGQYTDQKYGWYDLSGMEVSAVPGGYVIEFPKVEPLTNN